MSVQMTASEIELAKLHADLAVKEARFQLEKARLQVEEAHYAFVLAQQSLFSKQIELNVICNYLMCQSIILLTSKIRCWYLDVL